MRESVRADTDVVITFGANTSELQAALEQVQNDVDGKKAAIATAPAAGSPVVGSFSFYFRVRFADDSADFEQFMHQLWQLQSLELVSVK